MVRRITTSGRVLPSNTITIVKNFFNTCHNVVNKSNFSKVKVINMDDTCIYLDFPSNYTYASKGSKGVKANTTGGERAQISSGFTASADGYKFPIFLIIPRKNYLPNFIPPDNVVVHYKSGSTFNK
ncbi:unnamed protein product [Brachionus calyciflorus]|uniref:DDE-1 domain-containing protein n=1 Tax=Brachionus calyciflorus TaxID=104777 RepID=A0A813SZM5_9BILA|nr:unnamed protein product [Brachionus calyciflorus]